MASVTEHYNVNKNSSSNTKVRLSHGARKINH